MEKKSLCMVVLLGLAVCLMPQTGYSRPLTSIEVQRVKALKGLLDGADGKSLWQTIGELEKNRDPRLVLTMKEAEAHAYADIAGEYGIRTQAKKEWLYSMVCLNMAYLQFGGDEGRQGSTTELNRLIRQKLIRYLPAGILKQQEFLNSLQ
ncbi:MAG: hypothetical protein KGK03_10080 [Candidatus Omnitrophica bacterium]|nr:hypothetical protein [Candidatus Omnitrophota bacterium]MDE2223400.1 hypothetical protein [Candidatus Omnitrophota bacterium]